MNPLRAIRNFRVSRIQLKLLAIVGVAMAVAVAVAVGALWRVYGAAKDVERLSREDYESQLGIVRSEVAFKSQVREWQNLLLRGADPQMRDNGWNAFLEAEKSVHDFAADARATTKHAQVASMLDDFLAAHAEAGRAYRRAFEAASQGSWDAAGADKASAGLDRGPAEHLEEAEAVAQQQGARLVSAAVDSGTRAFRVAVVATLVAMVAALAGVWLYSRRALLAPIASAAAYAQRIARGDLTAGVQSHSSDEAGELLVALGRMNAGLSEVVSQVRAAAESVVSASGQVAAGTTDLSQRTEEQASSLEETAASMEELSSTVRQNADNAREADELALNASKRAEQGGREVARVVVTMSAISESAGRIADIISVIDGIAFQTNILALNAAVEAARAGEQGRGFAVVAAEVRSLAQRSSAAAKEIRDLIGESVAQVDEGTKLVDQAGGTISALVGDVKRVSGLMRSIAEASAEQSRGVQQVNKTVTEMDKVVQQNASAVQQSAAAAEAMRRQADALLRAVGAFRLAHGPALAAAPAGLAARLPAAAPVPMPAASPRATPGPAPTDEWQEF
ncbi:MAG TPA: methyl-accepting chemotaxis protein [Usitatibacter sp.]|nr:methyl-accepting chemotaxis protein [Usitatibacter sp.]